MTVVAAIASLRDRIGEPGVAPKERVSRGPEPTVAIQDSLASSAD